MVAEFGTVVGVDEELPQEKSIDVKASTVANIMAVFERLRI
jgi:hypothetical protein